MRDRNIFRIGDRVIVSNPDDDMKYCDGLKGDIVKIREGHKYNIAINLVVDGGRTELKTFSEKEVSICET